jgi:hypothetical protein
MGVQGESMNKFFNQAGTPKTQPCRTCTMMLTEKGGLVITDTKKFLSTIGCRDCGHRAVEWRKMNR